MTRHALQSRHPHKMAPGATGPRYALYTFRTRRGLLVWSLLHRTDPTGTKTLCGIPLRTESVLGLRIRKTIDPKRHRLETCNKCANAVLRAYTKARKAEAKAEAKEAKA